MCKFARMQTDLPLIGLCVICSTIIVMCYVVYLQESEVFEITDFTTASDWERSVIMITIRFCLICGHRYVALPLGDCITRCTWCLLNICLEICGTVVLCRFCLYCIVHSECISQYSFNFKWLEVKVTELNKSVVAQNVTFPAIGSNSITSVLLETWLIQVSNQVLSRKK